MLFSFIFLPLNLRPRIKDPHSESGYGSMKSSSPDGSTLHTSLHLRLTYIHIYSHGVSALTAVR
jgi:hypothetical protein